MPPQLEENTMRYAADADVKQFRRLIPEPHRIKPDDDGWPTAPALSGCVQWRGQEADGTATRLSAYTARSRMIPRPRAVPGLPPQQIGDREGAFWFLADDKPALEAVIALLRLRRRASR